ncbi:MAG TPA: sulfite exporter TauE/SafE family protein [Jatrophihabitantaceae bacterium]|nr:sulfite exporter TauE/SafE family protein [Jatrophihabitantaceae bacterium]
MDWALALGALVVGICVGLTGMGGGALMTPMLVIFFGVSPLAAVSSDLVASAVMRPVGAFVHLRHGNARLDLVRWLCLGSVPAAFCGVLIARALGSGDGVQNVIQKALGVALIVAASGLLVRAYLRLAERAAQRDGHRAKDPKGPPQIVVKPLPTVLVGLIGGLVVGLTSVGSGSLIIIALMTLYPTLRASELVGTDLVQAVPLVLSAAIGQLIFGQFEFSVTAALLVGSIPGAYIGAQLSSRLPSALIRRALGFVLLASALKMLGVGNVMTLVVLAAIVVVSGPVWMLLRRSHGFPALPSREAPLPEHAEAVG